ncbi:TonB-dependent receptor [Variovorax sp. PAMC26660]|uniref:TonB-dependent receptor n=1 Tax=Variovorax sp. PAMC26660 TaxID=2762322 RepID=UPI00164E29EA|nr:TonB-dependent receptor [Variovorax sp. PAMC26660]QNK68615.1 TonB-dependent receptor [Variovorax sp. PAMC26660]
MNRLDRPGFCRTSRPLSLRAAPLALLVASAVGLMGQTVQAQPAPVPPSPDAPSEAGAPSAKALDSVTVTATRRREPVREVPMQVNVLQGEALERAGAKTLSDYVADQPGINLMGTGTVGGALSIRGLTTGQQTISTVGVYIDDVATGSSAPYALGSSTPLDMGLLDLNHIEILRGPQGTLYGAGAMGGVLKYVTNQPDTTEFAGSVTLGTSSTKGGGPGYTASTVLNVPIKEDVAAIRIAAFHDHFGGDYRAVGPAAGWNINSGNTDGARLSLLLTPTRELKVRLTATTQDVRRNGSGIEDLDPVTGRPIEGNRTRRLYLNEPFRNRTTLYGLDVEYDFGWARLNSITSVQDVKISTVNDVSPNFVPTLALAGLPAQSARLSDVVPQHRLSQEFRLTSRPDSSIEWLAGLYLNRERGNQIGSADATLGYGLGNLNLITSTEPSTYREVAAYGDVTWHPTPALSLTGGVRVARNHQSYTSTSSGLLTGPTSTSGGTSSESADTYLLAAKYALTPTSNVYVRAASGYRPGGPNGLLPGAETALIQPMFKSDSLWSYELGYKADLLARTLSLEAALYDIEWRNIQQFVKSGAFNYYTNAGNARIRGGELTLNWMPSTEWRVNASASAIDAHLTTSAAGLGANAGARLPMTARFSATVGATRQFVVAGRQAYLGVSARHVGERDAGYAGSTILPSFRMPAYTVVDLQAGIAFPHFSLAAYVRNLGNSRGLTNVATINPGLLQAALTPARTVGMNLTVPF